MKKHASKLIAVIIMIAIALSLPMAKSSSQAADAVIKNLEGVLFEKLPGKERISLVVSQQPAIKAEGQTNGSLLVKLEDTVAGDNLQKVLGEGQLNNILRVRPSVQKVDGKQWTNLLIDIRELVPYSIKQEGKKIFIDFNVAGLAQTKPAAPAPPVAVAPVKAATASAAETKKTVAAAATEAPKAKPIIKEEPPKYTQRRISIDFQDAEIKSVLRLLAEYGDVNIVAGDDVKGKVTLAMKNVPWEQALDTILEVNSLAKRQEYNVITVTTMAKSRKDAADREKQREVDQKILAQKGLLKQILIEAKIVEASDAFVRDLGINWGFADRQHIGSYGSRTVGGTNTNPITNKLEAAYPPEITAVDTSGDPLYMAAVNMASAIAGPTLGFVIGKGTSFIEAQLHAMERTTSGKVISSPKVVTMDDVKATIKQGLEVPYTTQQEAGAYTVSFKDALLQLEVKPRITAEGKISMDIKASNDRPDWANEIAGQPPIIKNEIASTVVIADGDTVVIGGVTAETDETVDQGVPWFYKIPVLGWLFKRQNINKEKRQLLIFITPKILHGDSFAESAGKPIN
ncbi:MAG: hypothetical protein JW914_10005 [Syntrophaceae bacterium]|nr:hypothetical protein [Syntrophaceae bacterium]